MTLREISVLRAFAALGPTSNAAVARELGRSMDTVYRVTSKLTSMGRLSHRKLQQWQITELGRQELAAAGGWLVGDVTPRLAKETAS